MPEGPSIVILREEAAGFVGQVIEHAEGLARLDMARLVGQHVVALHSWGKQFLIELPGFSLRIHLLLYGSYRINQRKESAPRLRLVLANGELNFYGCSVRYLEGPLDDHYDWRADVMADTWNPRAALKKLRARPRLLVCDALLDQNLFAGSGNIIKNEVLFRIRVHPLSTIGALPATKLRELVREVRRYSFEFLEWKRADTLKAHWQAHAQQTCPRCRIALVKVAEMGRCRRRSFFCERCQKRYGEPLSEPMANPHAASHAV